jgi:hypothetical protein
MTPLNKPLIDFPMTCDRTCMTVRGVLLQPGTEVHWLERVVAHKVRVRMPDGTEEIVHERCFRQTRELEAFKARFARGASRFDATVPGLREAVEALPDRRQLSRLSGEVRVYIETQFALIKEGV